MHDAKAVAAQKRVELAEHAIACDGLPPGDRFGVVPMRTLEKHRGPG